jgi:hypothetical protein
MKKVAKVALLAFLMSQPTSYAKIQFYVGGAVVESTISHDVTHDMAHWNKVFTKEYEISLKQIYDEIFSHTVDGKEKIASLATGTPQEVFAVLLNDNSSNILKKKTRSISAYATVGAFIYRYKAILIAFESYIGGSSVDETHKSTTYSIKSSAPSKITEGTYNVSAITPSKINILETTLNEAGILNSKKNPRVPSSYVDGECRLQNEVVLRSSFRTGILFRIGTILADRIYVFALLGADLASRLIKVTSECDPAKELTYYTSNPEMSGDINLTFYKFAIVPTEQGVRKITFNHRKNIIGIVGGCGAEIFITRRLSARADISYKHSADLRVKSTDQSAELMYRSSHWRFGGGIFFRF